jgi:hypothetical protein
MHTNQPYNKTPCRSAYGTDRSIDELYVQPLSPPDARTVLLPESDNCCADTPAIPIMVVLISLQPIKEELPEDRQDSVPICLRNRPCASTVLPHTIDKLIAPLCLLLRMIVPVRLRSTDRLTDRRALRSTYYHHVDFRLLRLQQTYPRCLTRSRLNRLLLLPPAAKPVPYCLPTPPQAQRKNCQWWNIWTKVT